MSKEREPKPFQEISFDELCLLVEDEVAALQGTIGYLQSLVCKAEYGLDHNFRVKILTDGEQIQIELETKSTIGFRT